MGLTVRVGNESLHLVQGLPVNPRARFEAYGCAVSRVAHPSRNLETTLLALLIVDMSTEVHQRLRSSFLTADIDRLSEPRMPTVVDHYEFVGIVSWGSRTSYGVTAP